MSLSVDLVVIGMAIVLTDQPSFVPCVTSRVYPVQVETCAGVWLRRSTIFAPRGQTWLFERNYGNACWRGLREVEYRLSFHAQYVGRIISGLVTAIYNISPAQC